jgi:hypothetical protein
MLRIHRVNLQSVLAFASAALSLAGASAAGDIAPTNDLPNPYQTVAPWGKLPDGRTWGAFNAVAIDKDGESVWVATRCVANPEIPPGGSPFAYDTCAGSTVAPVVKLDSSGKVMQSFGADMFVFPHKIHVDREGNVWVVDARGANERERNKHPEEKAKGHTVVKFSPQGKVLLTIGTPGTAESAGGRTEPTSVVVAPSGDIFIAEVHSGQAANSPPDTSYASQVPRMADSSNRSASSLGASRIQTPHDITMDSQGRLLVVIAKHAHTDPDQDGDSSRSGSSSAASDLHPGWRVYVADSRSSGFRCGPSGWKRGIRIGARGWRCVVSDPGHAGPQPTSAAEGWRSTNGNIYGAEVGPRQLAKHAVGCALRGRVPGRYFGDR